MADLIGDGGDNTLTGTAGPDTFQGNGGNDTLIAGPSGSDLIDGGSGADTLVLAGTFASYVIGYSGGSLTLTNGATVETVTGVERINFADEVVRVVGNGSEFTTIQAAVDAAASGDTILIAPGTYVEQVIVDGKSNLTIMAAPGAAVTVQAPADVVQTATSSSGREVHAVVQVMNATDVRLENINIDGDGAGNTVAGVNPNYLGINYRNASGSAINVDITGVRMPYEPGVTPGGHAILAAPRQGVGIQVDNDTRLAFAMTGGSIGDFQANATAFNNVNLAMTGVTVTGGGDQTLIQQNGIQAGNSSGTISGNTISGIGFAGFTSYASGIVAFANTNLAITNNTITGSNVDSTAAQVVGIYLQDSSDNVTVTGNIISHVDEAVTLTGDVTAGGVIVNSNTLTNLDTFDPLAWGLLMLPSPAAVGPVNAVGTDFNDAFAGGAGSDTFAGGAGNDQLDGGLGADSLTGGSGDDTYIVDSDADSTLEGVDAGTDRTFASIGHTLRANIENLILTGGLNASGNGNGLANEIFGNFGNNTLRGLGGADIVHGGDGDDAIYLDADGANDTAMGDFGADTLDLFYATGATAVLFGALDFAGAANGGGLGSNNFDGIERINGGNFIDTVTGGAGAEFFFGRAGNDQLFSGLGNDTIHGGDGNDRIDGGGDNDSWLGGDTGLDYVTGGSGNDRIDGGADGDTWLGGDAGLDYVTGGLGNDRIDGGADNDTWLGGDAGLDYITGGLGNDRIDGGADNDSWLGGDAGLDTITGGLGNDRIDGGADNDTWLGGDAGNDIVTGGSGNDRIDGGTENDTLYGQDNNDTITGGAGDDLIEGGAGTDGFAGGAGLDTFDFNVGSGSDNVSDFANDQDTLRIDPGYGFANAAAVVAATTASGSNAVIHLPGGFGIYLVGYLAANTIGSLGDDIVMV